MTTRNVASILPTLASFAFRPFQDERDYESLAQIIAAESQADGLSFFPTAGWLKNMFESASNADLARDVLIAEDTRTLEAAAYGRIRRSEQADGTRRYTITVRVHPAWRRRRLGTTLSRWLEARAGEIDHTLTPNPSTVIETWALDTQLGNIALLKREGYWPVRYGYEMTRPLGDGTPIPDLRLPASFEVRPARPEHYRAIWEADVEAFRDHNGFAEPDEAGYQAWLNDPTFFQPQLWKIAWHIQTNEIAGMVQNYVNAEENARLGRKRGYTENISVRRRFRKQGLARALIAGSLHMHAALGMTEAALGVDATNPTGALRVYEDCGFRRVKTEVTYQKRMTTQAPDMTHDGRVAGKQWTSS